VFRFAVLFSFPFYPKTHPPIHRSGRESIDSRTSEILKGGASATDDHTPYRFSYSRQNLLSTKSNEGFQNISTLEQRSNNPFAMISMSKSNSDHTSSQENTPLRRAQFGRNSSDNRNNSAVPPDVLNVNHNVNKSTDPRNLNENDYAFAYNEIGSNNCNIPEEQIFKECVSEPTSRRNEWHEEQVEEQHPK
jgi:hypothetical protein